MIGLRNALKSAALLSLILINVYGASKKPTDRQCAAMKKYFEKTSDDNLQRAHFQMLENCLYYNLSQQADSELKFANLTNTISSFAPIKTGAEKVQVSLSKTAVFYVIRLAFDEVLVKGSLNMSWNDRRLRWNPREWNLDKMKINNPYDVWTPKEYGKFDKNAQYSPNYVNLKDLWVDYKGQLTTVYQFKISESCQTDYASFPMNDYKCCFPLNGQLRNDVIRYQLDNSSIIMKEKAKSSMRIDQLTISVVQENSEPTVRLCLTIASAGSMQRTKLLLPVVISAILVVAAPLFGTLQSQLYAKMFALLLQFLCFQFLVGSFSFSIVETGGVIPKLFAFYEFTIAMTIASLLVTLICRALTSNAGRSSRFPPGHRWKLLASLVNKCWFWSNADGQQQQHWGAMMSDKNVQMTNGHSSTAIIMMSEDPTKMAAYAEEWKDLFNALHSLVSLLLVIFYVIISIVINF